MCVYTHIYIHMYIYTYLYIYIYIYTHTHRCGLKCLVEELTLHAKGQKVKHIAGAQSPRLSTGSLAKGAPHSDDRTTSRDGLKGRIGRQEEATPPQATRKRSVAL